MSEGVEILISADDQASAKFAQVAKAAENNVKQIKETGQKAKASTEFFGTLANLSGNSQLGSFASQIAGLTEKTGQFAEVSKAGGAGALAFKAGLVAAVGVIAFNVGKALGDIVFQTDKFERSMARAKERAKELADETKKIQARGFSAQKEDLDLIDDPKAKEEAQKQLFSQLDKNVQGVSARVKQGEKDVEAWADAWKITGERNAAFEMAQAQLAEDKALLATLKDQRDEVAAMYSERTKANEARRAEIAAAQEAERIQQGEIDKSKAYVESLKLEVQYLKASNEEKLRLDAARNTTEADEGEALQLLKERDAIKAKQEEEKKLAEEKNKAAEDAIRDAERLAEKEKAGREKEEADRLKEQEDSAALAKRIGEATTNVAVESRLLSRGPSQDKTVEVATNTAKANELLAEIPQLIATALAAILPKSKAIQIEKVN